jgi:RNA polymerase sigma factor (sigma-70 family)
MLDTAAVAYQQGNDRAFCILADSLQKDISYSIYHNYIPGYDPEDVEQELLILLDQTAKQFKPQKGAQFRTFYLSCAKNRINELRTYEAADKRAVQHNLISLDAFSPNPNEEDNSQQVEIPYDEQGFDRGEIDTFLSSELTEDEFNVVTLYLDGYGFKDISIKLGKWYTDKSSWALMEMRKARKKLQESW